MQKNKYWLESLDTAKNQSDRTATGNVTKKEHFQIMVEYNL